MWNKFFKVMLFLPLFLFLVSVILLGFYIGYRILWVQALVEAMFLLGIGIGLSSQLRKMKWLGIILIILYLICGGIIGSFETPKWGTTYLCAGISIYFVIIFAIKSIPKYNK